MISSLLALFYWKGVNGRMFGLLGNLGKTIFGSIGQGAQQAQQGPQKSAMAATSALGAAGATAMPAGMESFAKQLAGHKQGYMGAADDQQRSNYGNLGQQVRSQALGAGLDLNELEDAAMRIMNPNFARPTDEGESQWRNSMFGQVKAAGARPTLPQVNANPNVNKPNANTPAAGTQPRNNYMQQGMSMLPALQQKMNTPLQYDPQKDAVYQSASKMAGNQKEQAQRDIAEQMNSLGILNSSITTENVAGAYQAADDRTLGLIPGLAQNAQNMRQQDIGNLSSLMGAMFGVGAQEEQFAQADRMFPLQESAVTGKYLSEGLKDAYAKALQAKQYAESPFSTSDDLASAKSVADHYRTLIAQMGGDPDLVGFDKNYQEASTAVGQQAGKMTHGAQKDLLDLILSQQQTMGSMPKGSGDMVRGLDMYGQYAPLFDALEGAATLPGRQFDFSTWSDKQRLGQESERIGLSRSGQSLESDRLAETKKENSSQNDYRDWQKTSAQDEQKRAKASSAMAAQAMANAQTMNEAAQWIADNMEQFNSDSGGYIDPMLVWEEVLKSPRWTPNQQPPAAGGWLDLP